MYNSCKLLFSKHDSAWNFIKIKKQFFYPFTVELKTIQLGNLPASRWINKVNFFHNSVAFALPVFLQIRLTLAKLF
jgi:hypothetical protein